MNIGGCYVFTLEIKINKSKKQITLRQVDKEYS